MQFGMQWQLWKGHHFDSKLFKRSKERSLLNGKSSEWATTFSGVPKGSAPGPLFFHVYLNDLADNINSNIKMFVDDTSLFSVVGDETSTVQ